MPNSSVMRVFIRIRAPGGSKLCCPSFVENVDVPIKVRAGGLDLPANARSARLLGSGSVGPARDDVLSKRPVEVR